MDVRITEGPFGKSIQISHATPAQVLEVMAGLTEPRTPEVVEEGRAYVGQTIHPGTRFGDFPQGIKLAQDKRPDEMLSVLQVSQDGRSYCWVDRLTDPFNPGSQDDRDNSPTIDGVLTVKEIW